MFLDRTSYLDSSLTDYTDTSHVKYSSADVYIHEVVLPVHQRWMLDQLLRHCVLRYILQDVFYSAV